MTLNATPLLTPRILLIDLWEGPAQVYYTGRLLTALAQRKEIHSGFLHNKHQDMSSYPSPLEHFPINAPTNARLEQWRRMLAQPWEFARCLRAIRRFKPDLIHFVFTYPWFTLTMPLIAKRYPVVFTMHDVTPHHGEEKMRNIFAIRSIVNYAKAIFVHGPQCLKMASDLYPERRNILVEIPLGHYDFPHDITLQEQKPEPATFLFFGRLLPYKGLSVTLEALKRILPRHPEAKIIIAGEGSLKHDRAAIGSLARNLEVINRRVSEEELSRLMARSLALLAPYTHASGSGVVATAYAFARAVIASHIGGLIDMVVHDQTGWFVEPNDADGLASAMERAIENPVRMLLMGRQAKEYARTEWGWERIADVHIRTYLKCPGIVRG
jgi:glycosyltransferase involved in cell wall biosynthesis